ncbi:lysozyme inhibitor LprI family protein [Cognatishimia sp. WU-CL00825]|uniref:lysozyme inhibitor LprI family protein n=1 Tax=Cognatishimia sp. WU-CL00825 TaxID=3127658 RepID=UPI003106DF1F
MHRILCLVALCATPVFAQDIDCENAMTQQAMNQCAHLEWQAADQDLNLAYGIAMAQAKSQDAYISQTDIPAATLLRNAQRAWIDFRDKACALEGTIARGGSMQPLLYWSCFARETRQRTESLRLFGEVN